MSQSENTDFTTFVSLILSHQTGTSKEGHLLLTQHRWLVLLGQRGCMIAYTGPERVMTGSTGTESVNDWLHWDKEGEWRVLLGQSRWVTDYTGTDRVNEWLYWERVTEIKNKWLIFQLTYFLSKSTFMAVGVEGEQCCAWTLLVPYWYSSSTSTLPVLYQYSTCTLPVLYQSSSCSVLVVYLCSTCSLSVFYLFSTCSLHVQVQFWYFNTFAVIVLNVQ